MGSDSGVLKGNVIVRNISCGGFHVAATPTLRFYTTIVVYLSASASDIPLHLSVQPWSQIRARVAPVRTTARARRCVEATSVSAPSTTPAQCATNVSVRSRSLATVTNANRLIR